jgi:LacI family transcriptional regulator
VNRALERRATIRDVAARAGVSIKTVARVFSEETKVKAETRQVVLEVAKELDYHVNIAARSLASRRSYLIGVINANPSPNYLNDLHNGAVDRLHGTRYRLIILPMESKQYRGKVLALARASGLDGLVLSPPVSDDNQTLDELLSAGLPFSRIGPVIRPGIAPEVLMDDAAAAEHMTQHLIELGHIDIAVVLGAPSHASSKARLDGFRRAMAQAGLHVRPEWVAPGMYSFESGLDAGRRLLGGEARPTAIFAFNDDMAAGVITAAHEREIAVPDELSIVGFDNSGVASVVWPTLTTIHQPIFQMARMATDALLARIEQGLAPQRVTMPFELIIRNSAGRPRQKH